MNIQVVDEAGKSLAMDRDLASLQARFSEHAAEGFSTALPSSTLERSGLTQWDFGELPATVDIELHGQTLHGYPALVDEGDSVAIQVLDTQAAAEQEHAQGLVRLLALQLKDKLKYLARQGPVTPKTCLHYVEVDSCEQLREDFLEALLQHVCLQDGSDIRTAAAFGERLNGVRNGILREAARLGVLLDEILLRYYQLGLRLAREDSPAWEQAVADIQEQLDNLVYAGFLRETAYRWLQQYPRYLKAMEARLDRLQGNVDKDAQKMAEVRVHFDYYLERYEAGDADPQRLDEYRWAIEEFRVSLFAQELKTVVQVSSKRLQQMKGQLTARG